MMCLRILTFRSVSAVTSHQSGFIGMICESRRLSVGFRKTQTRSFDGNELPEEFERNLYRNDVQLIGKTASNPQPIKARMTGTVIGYQFPLEIPNQDFDPVRCSIMAYKSANDGLTEYITENVRNGQSLKIAGFLRKSIMNSYNKGEEVKEVFYSIGPKSIRIIDGDDSDESPN